MNLKKILNINEAIKQTLPKTYFRPKIALVEDRRP